MTSKTEIYDPTTEEDTPDEERVWELRKDWIAIKAQAPGGTTAFNKFSINYFETGMMTKKSQIGVTQAKCLILHFQNGQSSGIPTLDPDGLLEKILGLMADESREDYLIGWAQTIISNVDGGDWQDKERSSQSLEWVTSARKWLDQTTGAPADDNTPEEPAPAVHQPHD